MIGLNPGYLLKCFLLYIHGIHSAYRVVGKVAGKPGVRLATYFRFLPVMVLYCWRQKNCLPRIISVDASIRKKYVLPFPTIFLLWASREAWVKEDGVEIVLANPLVKATYYLLSFFRMVDNFLVSQADRYNQMKISKHDFFTQYVRAISWTL